MSMSEIIYTVRKQGAVKVATKQEALTIVEAAAKEGYNFVAVKQGWSYLVEDNDL